MKILLLFSLIFFFSGALIIATQPPPPACIEDEIDETGRVLETLQAARDGVKIDERIGDADLDGKPDRIIAFKDQCSGLNCYWALFLSNKGCVRFGGQFTGTELILLKSTHHSYKDIKVVWRTGCGGADRFETTFENDGYSYIQGRTEHINECEGT